MFIVLVMLFLATAFAFGTIASLAAALSWRAYAVVTLLGGGYVAWEYLHAPATASPGSPSSQFVMQFVAAGFLCGAIVAPLFGLLIRAVARRKPDSPTPQQSD